MSLGAANVREQLERVAVVGMVLADRLAIDGVGLLDGGTCLADAPEVEQRFRDPAVIVGDLLVLVAELRAIGREGLLAELERFRQVAAETEHDRQRSIAVAELAIGMARFANLDR